MHTVMISSIEVVTKGVGVRDTIKTEQTVHTYIPTCNPLYLPTGRFSSDYTDYAESEKKKSGGQDETTFTIPNKAGVSTGSRRACWSCL